MMNGIYEVEANSIKHWVKVEGAEQGTSPLVILHGGPGGIITPLNIRQVLFFLKRERSFTMSSEAAAGVLISKIIHHHLKNSRFQPFQQSAHFPDLDEPEYFVQVVQDFLNHEVFSKARKIAARKKRAARWLLLN